MSRRAKPNPRGRRCVKCGTDNWMKTRNGKGHVGYRCRNCWARRARLARQRAPAMGMFQNAKRRAAASGVPFDVVSADVTAMYEATPLCPYCGVVLRRSSMVGGHPASPTLDRVIPAAGYTLGNVVVACHKCNARKADWTPAELRVMADLIEKVMRECGAEWALPQTGSNPRLLDV